MHYKPTYLKILRAIRESPLPLSRSEIERATGLGSVTVKNTTQELLKEGILLQVDKENNSKLGRKPILWGINPKLAYLVGVEIGQYSIDLVLTDLEGKIITSSRKEVPPDRNQWFEFYADAIDGFIHNLPKEVAISYIGISIPGIVNKKNGDLHFIGEFYPRGSVVLEEKIRKKTGIETLINNRANCAATTEYRERIRKGYQIKNLLYVTKALGMGIIIKGDLFYGADGTAGEIGHMTVNNTWGSTCECGKRDCLNLSSTQYIMRKRVFEAKTIAASQDTPVERPSTETIFAEAVNGVRISQTIVEESGLSIGKAISTLIELLAPDVVILQKPSSSEEGNGFFLDRIIEGAKKNFSRDGNTIPPIEYSLIGENADILGATLLAGDTIFNTKEMIQKHILKER